MEQKTPCTQEGKEPSIPSNVDQKKSFFEWQPVHPQHLLRQAQASQMGGDL